MWPSTHPPPAGASQSPSPHPAALGRGHGGIGIRGPLGRAVRSGTGWVQAYALLWLPWPLLGDFWQKMRLTPHLVQQELTELAHGEGVGWNRG